MSLGCISGDSFSQARGSQQTLQAMQVGPSSIELRTENPLKIPADALIIPFTPSFEIDRSVFDYYAMLPE